MDQTIEYTLIPLGDTPGEDWTPGPHVVAYVDTVTTGRQSDDAQSDMSVVAHALPGTPIGLFGPFDAMSERIIDNQKPTVMFPRVLLMRNDPDHHVGLARFVLTGNDEDGYHVDADIHDWLSQPVRNGAINALAAIDQATRVTRG